MFRYFGRKCQHAAKYQEPFHDKIIEPFAGSAAYSLHGNRWRNEILLFDINPIIIGIWNYLISANSRQILKLPNLYPDDRISNFTQLIQEERWLLGFHCSANSSVPQDKVSVRTNPRNVRLIWNYQKIKIAKDLHKIKHWKVDSKSYEKIPNQKATWFIDPPYVKTAKFYPKGTIDFEFLSDWCRKREGQKIVCESEGAVWLPFQPLYSMAPMGRLQTEVVWMQDF